MGIVESYKKKLEDARQAKVTIKGLEFPDKDYVLMNLESEIQEYERKINRFSSVGNSIQCDVCSQWVSYEEQHTVREISGKAVCLTCRGAMEKVLMSHEAEAKWSLPTGRIKQDCRRGTLDIYIENGLIRKAGKYWLVHELVGQLHYEKKKKESQSNIAG